MKTNWFKPTIARDLALGLVLTITLVFGVAGTINYFYSVDRDSKALFEKASEIMGNMASVLMTPLWNLNTEEIQKIVDVYRQSGIVVDIWVQNEDGRDIVPRTGRDSEAFLEMSRVVYHEDRAIGRVTVWFTDSDIVAKQQEIATYTLIVFTFLTFALIFATSMLLRRFLTEPFNKLIDGLSVISSGHYAHTYPVFRQRDVNEVSEQVMGMAREIAKRESALEANRYKLEILNQAILDIFSCSDTNSLIRTVMTLAHKVSGVDHGWFLGRQDGTAGPQDEDKNTTPPPLVCVRGHIFETSEDEVTPHIGQHNNTTIFTFPIKSRYRTVGQLTLAFDSTPDPAVTSLLKSLMSLATLAMIRQSFIRETAFISAELQVAETVQRSMLLDDTRAPRNATISYHYEPVLRVGGDWFSIIESRDGSSLYIILGDVTGHGLAQGLVTTAMAGAIKVVESMIHDFGTDTITRPSQIVGQLDAVIRSIAGKSNLRMTCVAAQIDFTSMQLHICNAGHTFPLVLRQEEQDAHVESLARNQQHMLGEAAIDQKNFQYTDASYDFHAQDVLVFYTDGLTEALDKEGKPFLRKFHRHFSRHQTAREVQQVRDDLIRLFKSHTQDVPVKDDICLLVVGKRSSRALKVA